MFSEKLKEIRLKKGLSQIKLASILGVTQSAVANWERGSRIPDLDTLLLISSELSVSLDSLLEKNDNSKKITLSSLPSICGFSDGAPVFSEAFSFLPSSDAVYNVSDESMSGAGIHSGDCALIKFSDRISSGEIALVYTDETLALRRVYSEKDRIVLTSDNKSFAPAVFIGDESGNLRIVGKVVGLVSSVI